MKKQVFITGLLIIIAIESYSQIVFENGYFINESNQKVECLIKNIDWKNNPTEFEYKLMQDSNIQKAEIQTTKEFGIYGVSKYIRARVQIDKSIDNVNNINSDRNPVFQEEELFLKALVEGKASLFLYENGNLERFFYNLNDSEIEQLIYKRYLFNYNIEKNNHFRVQLLNNLKCQTITLNDIEDLNYTHRDLERFFIKYNECFSSGYINYKSKEKKDLFNLTFRPGLNYSSLSIQSSSISSRDTDFGSNLGFRFGIEAEFILPFNKNKWGIIIEPTYQNFKSEKSKETSSISGGILVSKVNYKSIELPVGLRHYFYLNDDSKIFVNLSYIVDFANNSSVKFLRNDGSMLNELEIKTRNNLAFGLGYKHNNRYSLEFRYQTSREILSDYLYFNSNYNTLSVIFGYSLF